MRRPSVRPNVQPIWPQPVHQTLGSSVGWLDKHVPLIIDDSIHCMLVRDHLVLDILNAAYERLKRRVFEQGVGLHKFSPSGHRFEPRASDGATIKRVVIRKGHAHASADTTSDKPDAERYTLNVELNQDAIIVATSYQGWLQGLTALSQLFFRHSERTGEAWTPFLPATISDFPTFEHRGLMIDIARNRVSPKMVTRILDAMSQSRMNRLHLHAWDSQSWPIEIPSLPELAEMGAYDRHQIWSVYDLATVQMEGFIRGIDVYLEGDLPGHTASIHNAYPDLITGHNLYPFWKWGTEPPTGQLKLNSPSVQCFLEDLFDDLLPRAGTYSDFFHLGCDEVNKEIYELDETVRSSDKEVLKPLLGRFMQSVVQQTREHGLRPIVWEEAVLEWDVDLGKDTIIQAWRSDESVQSIVAKGHSVIASSYTHWYLDAGFGSWAEPVSNAHDRKARPPYPDWIGRYNNWRQVLSYNPLKGVADEHKHLVLGGEVCMWSELADDSDLDGTLWPRVCAAAEVLWRGRGEVVEASTRALALMRERLVAQGFGCKMVQMEWCLRNPYSARSKTAGHASEHGDEGVTAWQ